MKKSTPTPPSSDEPMTERLQIVASEAFVEKLDAWRAKQRKIPTRSEAIRRLVEIGLKAQQ